MPTASFFHQTRRSQYPTMTKTLPKSSGGVRSDRAMRGTSRIFNSSKYRPLKAR